MDTGLLEQTLIILYVFCTAFAACLGSFSNVVIYRVPNHMSIAWPPSGCPKCGARIKPYDNIPVFSWLILRGKCRNCKNPISPQYVIVEFICALFGFFLCRQIFEPNMAYIMMDGVFWRLLLFFVCSSIFLVGSLALAVIDYQTTEIPPEIALPIGGLGILTAFLVPETMPFALMMGNIGWLDSVLGCVIGAGIVIAIIGLYYLATKRIGMGGGDIWMMAMVGAFLGWECLPFIFLASSLQGIIVAIIAICLGRRQKTGEQNGLFRNEVAGEVEAEIHGEDSKEAAEAADDSRTGRLAVPYGPFIALASVEYVFLGQYLLPIISGGTMTPWGFVQF